MQKLMKYIIKLKTASLREQTNEKSLREKYFYFMRDFSRCVPHLALDLYFLL